jgi:hypothetical protein
MRTPLALFALPALLAAQIEGPVLGYLPDAEGGLRPLLGLAASAMTGPAFEDSSLNFRVAAVSPRQDWVLALDRESGAPVLARISRGGLTRRSLDLPPSPAQMLWSANGRAAVLVYSESRQLAVLRNAAGSAPETRLFDLPSGEIRAIAVSDGGAVAVAAAEAEAGVVSIAEWQGSWARSAGGGIAALAFDGDDVLAAGALEIQRLRGGETSVVASWDQPRDIRFLAAAERHWIASTAEGDLLVWNRDSGELRQANCGCEPGAFQALGSGVFRLTGITEGGIVLVDASSESLVLRVPPPAGPPATEAEAADKGVRQ